jgi:hypothetical protein
MKALLRASAALAALTIAPSALADDSSAMLGAGGIVLTKNADIRMATEDLTLSPTAVRVHYTFVNDSGSDVDTIVAFPLPDVDNYEYSESAIGTTKDVTPNFVGFALSVDGAKIAPTAEELAIYQGKDVTAQVRAAGLPPNLVVGDGYDRLQKLSPADKAMLRKAGLIDGGEQKDDPVHAKWLATTKFWWHMKFPAGKTVSVDHTYQPVTGQTFFTPFTIDDPDEMKDYRKNYCIDGATEAAIRARFAGLKKTIGEGNLLMNQYTTAFVIVTANNWKGPIGRFHLTIDKLKPENILSLCWDGDLKKTGPTRFESTLIDLAPKKDIRILVLENPKPGQQ